MVWQQIYNPFGNMIISTALAAIPVIVMLGALGFFHIKAHIAAGMGLVAACDVAVSVDTAWYCLSEVKIGLIPATISPA